MFKYYENIGNMFEYRGLDKPTLLTQQQFVTQMTKSEFAVVENDTLCVVLLQKSSKYEQKTDTMKQLAKQLPNKEILLVTFDELSNHIGKYIRSLNWNHCLAKVFVIAMNKHCYFQKHEIATQADIDVYCTRLNTQPDRFKKIQSMDTAAIWCGAKPGQTVKITGVSETAGLKYDLRFCV